MWSILFRAYLKLNGWSCRIDLPPHLKKFVLIALPHTSNFDFPVAKAAFYIVGVKVRFLAKESLFTFPFGHLFRKWGGIPVNRSQKNSLVSKLKETFDQNEEMVLAISPEGTRDRVDTLKMGFYYIAKEARVPIVCGFIDYEKKEVGLGPIITDLSSIEAVKSQMREFYRLKMPKFPDKFNENFS